MHNLIPPKVTNALQPSTRTGRSSSSNKKAVRPVWQNCSPYKNGASTSSQTIGPVSYARDAESELAFASTSFWRGSIAALYVKCNHVSNRFRPRLNGSFEYDDVFDVKR